MNQTRFHELAVKEALDTINDLERAELERLTSERQRECPEDTLHQIRDKLDAYHQALDARQHAAMAGASFINAVERILYMPWIQNDKRRSKR